MVAFQSAGLIVAAAVLVSANAPWPPASLGEKMAPVILKCLKKQPLDEEVIKNARLGKIAEDPKLKAFLLCGFDAFDSIDHQTGEILHYKLLDLLPDAESQRHVIDMGKECLKIHEPNAADTVFKFVSCMFDAGARLTFF